MTAKTSISLTDAQEAFARQLVARGRYASLSAVLQHGLDLLRARQEAEDAETQALRALLDDRCKGHQFVGVDEGRKRTGRMIAARKSGK
ncbi:MAG: type II toxin-antitoxin system ParD family antitoxin [Micropepsaceae bacterium]